MARWLSTLLKATSEVLMPRRCPVCGRRLSPDEQWVCRGCMMRLPRTHFENAPFNVMEQLFAGKTPVERAAAYFYYEKRNPYSAILHDIKYHSMPALGTWMGIQAARDMAPSGLWQDIEALVPVPLHVSKLAKRGYNQTEKIALGLSQVTGIPIVEAIEARRPHSTQTHKGMHERYLNSKGIYRPVPEAARWLSGKHVMIVDDVVTTGATLLTCAECLSQAVPGIKISLFTLAAARLD